MNKTTWLALLVFLAVGPLAAGILTVVKPNGNEFLTLGQANCQIQWNAVGVTQNIRVNLVKDGAVVGTIAASLPPGSSPFLWTAGQLADGTMVQLGAGYKVRIRAIESSEADESDGVFSLVAPPPPPSAVTLTLGSPNGGESWVLGAEHAIRWSSTNLTGKVQLMLVRYNDRTLGVIADNLPVTGSITWKAGEYPGNTAPVGQYLISVYSMSDTKIFDTSDNPFRLGYLIKQSKKIVAFKATETLPGIYQNYPGTMTFPSKVTNIPNSVLAGAYAQFASSACGSPNQRALVGVNWFPYSNVQVAGVYRSRILFPLSAFAGKNDQLTSAKLKMKRIHSIHEDANSGCGCNENIWVLMAPMTAFAFPDIGQRVEVDMGASEFSKDITDIVKKWLDGTVANNGLLLLAGELPCSGGRLCFSCYEASLLLYMK